MRFLSAFMPMALLAGCSTHGGGPVTAQTINPEIERRIDMQTALGAEAGTPDLRAMRTEPPKLPGPAAVRRSRAQIEAAADALLAQLERDRALAADEEALLAEAEALRAQVARDRALAEREGSAADRLQQPER